MKLVEHYNSAEKTFTGIVLAILVLGGFFEVVFRYVLKMPVAWFEEVMLFCFVWCTFVGASVAWRENSHPKMELLVDALPRPIRRVMDAISCLLSIICVCLLIYASGKGVISMIERGAKTIGGGFPYWVAAVSVPVGAVAILIRACAQFWNIIRGKPQSTEETK